jgi:hypothetical protein
MSYIERLFPLLLLLYLTGTMSGCQPALRGPTHPSGYHIRLPEASQAIRLQPLVLTVRVTDAAGQPADDVPVHFRVPDAWAVIATIHPPSVITQQGQASATLRARAAAQMSIEVTVEDRTESVRIQILGDVPRF